MHVREWGNRGMDYGTERRLEGRLSHCRVLSHDLMCAGLRVTGGNSGIRKGGTAIRQEDKTGSYYNGQDE